MAAERVTSALNALIKEAVLAAVREELAAHKEEVDELRRTLLAAGDQNNVTAVVEREREFAIVKGELAAVRAELEAVKGELEAVKGELEAVKGELAEHKGAMAEQCAENSRAPDVRGLKGKSRKRSKETSVEFGKEEERKEVQEVNRPRGMEESAAGEGLRRTQDLKLNVEVEIRQSEGDQKAAREEIKSAAQETDLELRNLSGLSDDILAHVSTRTHLTRIDLDSSSGFSAEGIKHLYRLPLLEKLNLSASDVSDSALEGIGFLTRLTHLYLLRTRVTDAGLPCLTSLPSLRFLALGDCNGVTNAGMVHVGRLTGLEYLGLDRTAVTDDGLQHLTSLTKLSNLWMPDGESVRNGDVRRRIGSQGSREGHRGEGD